MCVLAVRGKFHQQVVSLINRQCPQKHPQWAAGASTNLCKLTFVSATSLFQWAASREIFYFSPLEKAFPLWLFSTILRRFVWAKGNVEGNISPQLEIFAFFNALFTLRHCDRILESLSYACKALDSAYFFSPARKQRKSLLSPWAGRGSMQMTCSQPVSKSQMGPLYSCTPTVTVLPWLLLIKHWARLKMQRSKSNL